MKEITLTEDKLVALMNSVLKNAEHHTAPETRQLIDKLSAQMEEVKTTLMDIKYIRRDLDEIKEKLEKNNENYITKEQFLPIQRIVYGLVGLVLTSVCGALIALVVRS